MCMTWRPNRRSTFSSCVFSTKYIYILFFGKTIRRILIDILSRMIYMPCMNQKRANSSTMGNKSMEMCAVLSAIFSPALVIKCFSLLRLNSRPKKMNIKVCSGFFYILNIREKKIVHHIVVFFFWWVADWKTGEKKISNQFWRRIKRIKGNEKNRHRFKWVRQKYRAFARMLY